VLTPLSVALLLLAFGLVWSGSYALTAFSPGTDNIEQLVWVRSLEWGYYKHPPLTTWLLGAAAAVFGPSVGLTYVLGTLVTLAALGLSGPCCAACAVRLTPPWPPWRRCASLSTTGACTLQP